MSSEDVAGMYERVRLILYHKHSASARTRFLKFDYGSVCAFSPFPKLSEVEDEANDGQVVPHPAPLVCEAERRLGLAEGSLEADGEFRETVDAPGGSMTVYLARFTGIDPPFDAAGRMGAEFVAITEARALPPLELELLRRAYETIMEG